jgi:hypothetical protein
MSARPWQGAKVAIMAKRMRHFMGPLYGEKMKERFIGWRFCLSGGESQSERSDHVAR